MNGTRQATRDNADRLRLTWQQLGMAFGSLTTGALVAFHAVLLWARIRDLSIFQPLVALEWLAGLLMLVVLWHLRRQRVPLFRGRKALAFWLLVLLLHLIAAPPAAGWVAEPSGLLLALPATWGLVSWVALLVALWAVSIRRQAHLPAAHRRRGSPSAGSAASPGHPFQLFARPPPFPAST